MGYASWLGRPGYFIRQKKKWKDKKAAERDEEDDGRRKVCVTDGRQHPHDTFQVLFDKFCWIGSLVRKKKEKERKKKFTFRRRRGKNERNVRNYITAGLFTPGCRRETDPALPLNLFCVWYNPLLDTITHFFFPPPPLLPLPIWKRREEVKRFLFNPPSPHLNSIHKITTGPILIWLRSFHTIRRDVHGGHGLAWIKLLIKHHTWIRLSSS